jgi:hypothetical protein
MNPMIKMLLPFALAAALLSGCFGYEDLMQAPRPALQHQRLQDHIDALLAAGYTYSYPLAGEHRQAILMTDLTGNGLDDAVVFLRRGETESLLTVFSPSGGDFVSLPPIYEDAESIHSVSFHDISGSGLPEIIVGWQVGALRYLSVYSLEEGGLTEIFTSAYSGYTIFDIEGSGTDSLLLIQIDSDRQTVEMVTNRNGELAVTDAAALSLGAEAVRRVFTGSLRDERPGMFITSQYQTSIGEVTDVFTFRDGSLVNISVNMETGVSDMLVRHRAIPAADIGGDGVFKIPRQVELPRHPDDLTGETFYELRWNAYESGGLSVETARTYHSAHHNWYILLPEQWPETYTVRRVTSGAQAITTFSLFKDGGETEDFLIIYYLFQSAANRPQFRDRTVLAEQTNLLVTAEIIPLRDEQTPFSMTEQELKELFHLNPMEWRS